MQWIEGITAIATTTAAEFCKQIGMPNDIHKRLLSSDEMQEGRAAVVQSMNVCPLNAARQLPLHKFRQPATATARGVVSSRGSTISSRY